MSKIILITGPSGAGKTTVCKEFLSTAKGEWAYVNQDELRQLVVAGYISADGYEKDWSAATRRQWAVSIPICTDVVKRYHQFNINCIVDLYAPGSEFEQWQELLKEIDYELYILLPTVEVTVERNAGRSERGRLKESKIRQNHSLFINWKPKGATIIDTSSLSIRESVDQLRLV